MDMTLDDVIKAGKKEGRGSKGRGGGGDGGRGRGRGAAAGGRGRGRGGKGGAAKAGGGGGGGGSQRAFQAAVLGVKGASPRGRGRGRGRSGASPRGRGSGANKSGVSRKNQLAAPLAPPPPKHGPNTKHQPPFLQLLSPSARPPVHLLTDRRPCRRPIHAHPSPCRPATHPRIAPGSAVV